MAHTHRWLAGCTGMGGKLLRTGKSFDPKEHPYISIVEAVADGKAEPLNKSISNVSSEEKKTMTEADYLPPSKAAPKPAGAKKGKK